MSSMGTEIELLERVLLRLGSADSDEKLEQCICKFLTPVLLKITSPQENVRSKVIEVLTHISKRLKSRSQVQIPVEALLDQFQSSDSAFLQNFSIIYITMGYPRLTIEKQTELVSKLFKCLKGKPEGHQDKLLMLLLPILGKIKVPSNDEERKNLFDLEDIQTRKRFISLLQDVLLLPYGTTQDAVIPPGFSRYSFRRVAVLNLKAEDLENLKKGIVEFICSGIFTDTETFILLVIASSDTRFSVATPAIAELSKVTTSLDFTDPKVTLPLYTLFSGTTTNIEEHRVLPCSARVRQKLLQYLTKSRDKGIDTVKGIQLIFEGLYGENTSQKCKVLVLQFCENLIKDGPKQILDTVSKVLLSGISKLIGKDSTEPIDVQNAAYSALAQLSRTCPNVINQDLKIVVSYFNHLSTSSPDLHTSIREALIAMAPAFSYNHNNQQLKIDDDNMENDKKEFILTSQQNLLLAMLSDNAESKLQIIQNVTSVYLTTCFPEYFPPARYLLLLIAGERSPLREAVTSYLYGVSKKDNVNYNMLSSIDHPEQQSNDDVNKLTSEQRRVILPGFKDMINYVCDMAKKRMTSTTHKYVVGKKTLPFHLNAYTEILDYLRICLWYSAGIKAMPGDEKYTEKFKEYILKNYKEDENNEIYKYMTIITAAVEAKRDDTSLQCLYDLLNAAPELLTKKQMHLLEPLAVSLKDISETIRILVAQIYGILLAYGLDDDDFNRQIREISSSLPQKSLENRHGWILVIAHAFNRKFSALGDNKKSEDIQQWKEFVESVKLIVFLLGDQQALLVSAGIKGLSLIGKSVPLPDFKIEYSKVRKIDEEMEIEDFTTSTKLFVFETVFALLKNSNTRAKIREDSAYCLGCLAIGDGEFYVERNLNKFLNLIKLTKDAALNISIAQAIVCTINGCDVSFTDDTTTTTNTKKINKYCNDKIFEEFLNSIIKCIPDPNPHSRQSCGVWLLALVKHCSHRPAIYSKKQTLQYAFTELLSDDSEFVQDVASRGLGLVYALSDPNSQNDLANSLLDQLIGGKRHVNQVAQDTELFAEGVLGKTPTGGNITTYKELCSLASDLNQPEMIYQFMQLANHNATWNSKLGAAFGLKSISKDAKAKMQSHLGKIIPRLYRYKYDPTPKIQNSMISIWDSIVTDSKETIELYYWDIMKEILLNLTVNEWRVRIACCLAVRDLIKRPNGLRLRSEEKAIKKCAKDEAMEVDDDVPEPELKELWSQLFRVMDDIHEGTRLAAEGTANYLSKICVVAASSDHGKSGMAVASSILPLILDVGVTHPVPEIRKISIKTISELIDSSGSLITPHLPTLIPCLLRATGELEAPKLSYLSTRLGAEAEAQEAVDSIRAEAAKSHHTMETTAKCVRYVDYAALENMTPAILDLIKSTVNLGTKIACAHFVCLISTKLGEEMTPLVGKYLGVCFNSLKDKNSTVRKYYASAIGHLVGIAKEQSIKNLLIKLEDYYNENVSNKGVPLVIQSINKRHHDLLKDYMENILPLIFYAMHEEINDENKNNIELWKELWIEISPGDAGIRMNLNKIIPKLEKSLNDQSWLRKIQSANSIKTIAIKLGNNLDNKQRLHLITILLNTIPGRTFKGKERLLEALSCLCKNLNKNDKICEKIIDITMKECKKEEPQYRTYALKSIGDILEQLEIDKFEEVYKMIWYLLDKKDLQSIISGEKTDDNNKIDKMEYLTNEITIDERNKRANILNKLKETIFETLGKSWPKNSLNTQKKYQLQFVEQCGKCLKDNTRQVQVSLLIALGKFLDRLQIFDINYNDDIDSNENSNNKEKKIKIDTVNDGAGGSNSTTTTTATIKTENRDIIIEKICNEVLSAITYASSLPHTGLKKESLNIILILIKRLNGKENLKHLQKIKFSFEDNLKIFEKDSSPEIRCRIKDIEDKLKSI